VRVPNSQNRLRFYRLEADLAQDDLAQKVGVRVTTISRIERGVSYPSFPVAQALARVLSDLLSKDVAIEDLFPEPERVA
jgi:DNA-binding XRE family transcriptional regulator